MNRNPLTLFCDAYFTFGMPIDLSAKYAYHDRPYGKSWEYFGKQLLKQSRGTAHRQVADSATTLTRYLPLQQHAFCILEKVGYSAAEAAKHAKIRLPPGMTGETLLKNDQIALFMGKLSESFVLRRQNDIEPHPGWPELQRCNLTIKQSVFCALVAKDVCIKDAAILAGYSRPGSQLLIRQNRAIIANLKHLEKSNF